MDSRFLGRSDFRHDSSSSTGVLVANLGTPDAPTTGAVRRYLAEFLSDPRVIELPRWLWLPLLHGVILNVRPRRSAAAYREVWTEGGSPLLVNSRAQCAALQRALAAPGRAPVHVALGMRYGRPSIGSALASLDAAGITRLVVLPLYPQYSATTTGSVFDAVAAALTRSRWVPELRFVGHYHDSPAYVAALAESVREAGGLASERLLFSFHGLPRRYLLAGDPYHCQCHKTARLVAEALGLEPDRWAVAFQSRVGREEWLRPYTDELLAEWARAGVRAVHVVCPGFAADCLETLEEVAIRYRELFLESGGEALTYIPALNARDSHVGALVELLRAHAGEWLDARPEPPAAASRRADRARALGAAR